MLEFCARLGGDLEDVISLPGGVLFVVEELGRFQVHLCVVNTSLCFSSKVAKTCVPPAESGAFPPDRGLFPDPHRESTAFPKEKACSLQAGLLHCSESLTVNRLKCKAIFFPGLKLHHFAKYTRVPSECSLS